MGFNEEQRQEDRERAARERQESPLQQVLFVVSVGLFIAGLVWFFNWIVPSAEDNQKWAENLVTTALVVSGDEATLYTDVAPNMPRAHAVVTAARKAGWRLVDRPRGDSRLFIFKRIRQGQE